MAAAGADRRAGRARERGHCAPGARRPLAQLPPPPAESRRAGRAQAEAGVRDREAARAPAPLLPCGRGPQSSAHRVGRAGACPPARLPGRSESRRLAQSVPLLGGRGRGRSAPEATRSLAGVTHSIRLLGPETLVSVNYWVRRPRRPGPAAPVGSPPARSSFSVPESPFCPFDEVSYLKQPYEHLLYRNCSGKVLFLCVFCLVFFFSTKRRHSGISLGERNARGPSLAGCAGPQVGLQLQGQRRGRADLSTMRGAADT